MGLASRSSLDRVDSIVYFALSSRSFAAALRALLEAARALVRVPELTPSIVIRSAGARVRVCVYLLY